MLNSTVYDVRIRYAVDNRAGTGVRGLTGDVRQLGRETGRVMGLFQKFGAAAAGYFGVRAAGKALLGFNATVEDTKLQIAGMMALAKKTDLSDQLSNANRLFGDLQKYAKTHAGNTSDYTEMAGMLTQPILDAGLGMKDLENLTENAVVGAKALHVEWGAAARDIDQALRGQFHSTDVFTGKILGSVGFKGEEGRAKYNAMDPAARAETLRNALMQKQLVQLADAQGETFNGMLSTLQDTIGQFFGKVGLPLFKAITAELKHWNAWFDANQDKVDSFAAKFADGLVTGARAIKDGIGFLVDHADLLMAIGKVWLGLKLGGMVSGALGAGGGRAGGLVAAGFGAGGFFRGSSDRFNPETGAYEFTSAGRGRSAVGGFKGAMGNLPLLGQSLGVGYGVGSVINDVTGASSKIADGLAHLTGRVDETTDKFFQVQAAMDELDAATRRAAQSAQGKGLAGTAPITNLQGVIDTYLQRANELHDAGGVLFLKDEIDARRQAAALQQRQSGAYMFGSIAYEAGLTQLTDYQKRTLDEAKAQHELMSYMVQQIAGGKAFDPEHVLEILRAATEDPTGKYKPNMSSKPNVNITIQRIEVQSDDPDRFAFRLVDSFQEAVKNPSAAVRAIREG